MTAEQGSVLVVEDHDSSRAMLRRFLETKGFSVAEAPDGNEALAAFERRRPDLILLDSMLPGRSGLEVLEKLRGQFTATDLPIIMLSGRGRSSDIVEALRLGANDYLVKPFDITEALARVQTHLSLKRSVDQVVSMEANLARQNAELAEANQRMRESLNAAAAVQRALLPREPLNVPGAKFAWHFRPCDELAGDLLNVAVLDDRHVGVYILDVVGHGVKAALMAVMVSRVLGQLLVSNRDDEHSAWHPPSPAHVVAALSREFCWDDRTGQFCTLLCGILNVETGKFDFVSAGHPGPILAPHGEPARSLPIAGVPIGLGEAEFQQNTLTLSAGDRLYLYSDGLTESMDLEGNCFTAERVLAALEQNRNLPLKNGLIGLTQRVEQWSGPMVSRDDLSILAMEFVGASADRTAHGRSHGSARVCGSGCRS